MLTIHKLSYKFKQKQLIDQISLHLQPGKLYGIIGPNGAGKSTFLKTLSGIWSATSGKITWYNQNITSLNRLEKSKLMTLVPQNPLTSFEFTAIEMVSMGGYIYASQQKLQIPNQIELAMKKMDVWHLKSCPISQLSGGERQRVYIARALVTKAPIMLLDEPTAHLDLRHQLDIWQLLKQMASNGKLLVAAVHDLAIAKQFCDELIILNRGQCVCIGSCEQALTSHHLKEIFGLSLKEQQQLHLLLDSYC